MSGALFDEHHRELAGESAISEEVIAGRGYRSISRPTNTHDEPRQELKRLGIPTWATAENRYFPGLLIPLYRPTGERISAVFKPRVAVPNREGKLMKYAAVKNRPSVIDVHPANRDRIVDPTTPLWITEGVKKADSLTSRGLCVAALSGVYNWRSAMGSLGDWEDIPLRGRTITICFDADAKTNPNVLRAMDRFGRWLRAKGAGHVLYLIVPDHYDQTPVKGVDDWFAAGGSLATLSAGATTSCPRMDNTDATFTDAILADTIADEVLDHGYCWAGGKGWMCWDGMRWKACTDVRVLEAVRDYCIERFTTAAIAAQGNSAQVDGWRSMLSASRQRTVVSLARGIVEKEASRFDAHPDLLNTPSGVVDLETGEEMPHDPDLLMTKITGAPYRPHTDHDDWKKALEALPEQVRDYLQIRLGQAITGHMTPDDVLVVMHGGGENGKSTITEVMSRAVGEYFLLVSDRALMANPDAHPTELMDFQGARFAVLEETPEARRLNTQRLKRTIGTPRITARRIRKDSVTFDATHSLFLSTNHKPNVEESDHGTWRRLMLVTFPYRFRKEHEPIEGPNDRAGDPTLRERAKGDPDVLSAALAWLVEGARRWYEGGRIMPAPPETIVRDTRAWRAESDLITSYLDDRIAMDADSHVLAVELLDDFNGWLKDRGHTAWSDKTLAARLEGHDDIATRRIEKKKIRARSGMSRPPISGGWDRKVYPAATASVYTAWLGLRFATDADHGLAVEMSVSPLTRENEDQVTAVTAEKYVQSQPRVGPSYFPAVTAVTESTTFDGFQDRVTGVTAERCVDCGYLTTTRHHHRECSSPEETQR
jgi:P4 family phage/plasmid primase-like protien